jgi:hypothetical protein
VVEPGLLHYLNLSLFPEIFDFGRVKTVESVHLYIVDNSYVLFVLIIRLILSELQ